MLEVEEILDKYDSSVIRNFDKDNLIRIVNFLKEKDCDYIDELLEDYLDLFIFDFEEFKDKFNKLNHKYDDKFLDLVKEDMNYLEEFYEI